MEIALDTLKKQLKSEGWILSSYNYGKNLENMLISGNNPHRKIMEYLVDNPFFSYIDFDDAFSAHTEKLGIVTAYRKIVKGCTIAI